MTNGGVINARSTPIPGQKSKGLSMDLVTHLTKWKTNWEQNLAVIVGSG
jgi:hypothetical protein